MALVMPPRPPARTALLVLTGASAAALLVALTLGSAGVSPGTLVRFFTGTADAASLSIVFDLRLPRALTAFAVGGLLGLSGALLQALLRNPLADPYVLGISGGAAVAALIALALGAPLWALQVSSAGGAALSLLLLFVLARRALFLRSALYSDETSVSVLLTGVMIAAFASALLSLLLSLATDGQLRSMVFWLLGDLAGAVDLSLALVALVVLAVCVSVARLRAPALNLMLRGDVLAYTQGVDVVRERRVLIIVSAIATGTAVMLAGAVGFVGFVAPHLLRLAFGNDQRLLLPASALGGGLLVLLADTAARTVVAPLQLPVGVVTALLGVPVFLWLLLRR